MIIDSTFSLANPVDQVWPVLTDLERVAPCMPGVKVESVADDGLRALMRVKVGPVTVAYKALIRIESLDPEKHTAVLRASGREARGSGTLAAMVTAVLSPNGDGGTDIKLETDLTLTGKVAQLGGGVISDVADRLLGQFAGRIEADLTPQPKAPVSSDPGSEAGSGRDPSGGRSAAADDVSEVVDLGKVAGRVLAPRIAAATAIALALFLLLRHR